MHARSCKVARWWGSEVRHRGGDVGCGIARNNTIPHRDIVQRFHGRPALSNTIAVGVSFPGLAFFGPAALLLPPCRRRRRSGRSLARNLTSLTPWQAPSRSLDRRCHCSPLPQLTAALAARCRVRWVEQIGVLSSDCRPSPPPSTPRRRPCRVLCRRRRAQCLPLPLPARELPLLVATHTRCPCSLNPHTPARRSPCPSSAVAAQRPSPLRLGRRH
jgi:hypothetical protein